MDWGDNFGSVLIGALEAGRESKRRKMREAWEIEDRDVESKILQHRLRELKLTDELRKRQAAIENLGLLKGTPEADIPPSMAEGADSGFGPIQPGTYSGDPVATVPGSIQMRQRFKPQEIPGIPELGLSGFQVRPDTYEQSMERTIGDLITKKRAEAMWTPQRASRGGIVTLPATGEVLAKGDPYEAPPRNPIALTNRDAAGVETTTYTDPQDAIGKTTTRQPLPLRPRAAGAGGSGQAGGVEIEDFVDGVVSGRIPVSKIPTSALGVRISGALNKRGFDVNRAGADERAIRTFYANINDNDVNKLRMTMQSTNDALDALEELAGQWKGSGGIFSSIALGAAKNGAYGADAKQTASDIENTINTITQGLAVVGNNGSAPTNAALESAAKTLKSNWSEGAMLTAIKSLRKNLAIRSGAIEGLEPILPSALKQFNDQGGVDRPGVDGKTAAKIQDGAAPGVAQTGALTPKAVADMLRKIGKDNSDAIVQAVMANQSLLQQVINAAKGK